MSIFVCEYSNNEYYAHVLIAWDWRFEKRNAKWNNVLSPTPEADGMHGTETHKIIR